MSHRDFEMMGQKVVNKYRLAVSQNHEATIYWGEDYVTSVGPCSDHETAMERGLVLLESYNNFWWKNGKRHELVYSDKNVRCQICAPRRVLGVLRLTQSMATSGGCLVCAVPVKLERLLAEAEEIVESCVEGGGDCRVA